MIIFKHSEALRRYLGWVKLNKRSIGFVPTMGALHRGHVSLIEQSKIQTDLTVCSVFINPTQFNDKKDYEKYPVNIEQDIYVIESAGTDILFLPNVKELYPNGTEHLETYELGYLESILEGRFRPGHFQGVTQVMSRLLNNVQPDKLFMGQKDFQQALVVQQLLEKMKIDTSLVIGSTVREDGGLAMSSRNMRLNAPDRKKASAIYRTLEYIREHLSPGDLNAVKIKARNMLAENAFKIDYVEIADVHTLHLVNTWDGNQKLVALIAVFIDDVRLIDNLLLSRETPAHH